MKSGVEFRREMQRHSAVIRELIHYRGYPDPLKGDALNKAVRETAQEAMSNIFTNNNDNKAPVTESIGSRIQGFGNKNYEMRLDEKKSFFSEVVDIGRASIEQSLSSIAAAHSGRKSDNGNYRGPILSHSLTNEKHSRDRYEGNNNLETWNSSEITKSMGSASGNWVRVTEDSVANVAKNEKAPQTHSGCKSREERLLETIVTSGGVRLQPTRDSIYIFLTEASKMSPVLMCHAVESKLQSNLWKVFILYLLFSFISKFHITKKSFGVDLSWCFISMLVRIVHVLIFFMIFLVIPLAGENESVVRLRGNVEEKG